MRYTYRIHGDGLWPSNFGFAYMVILNPSGSGRKLTLRSLEVYVQTITSGASLLGAMQCALHKTSATGLYGEDMSIYASKFDSSMTLPSSVVLRRNTGGFSQSAIIRHLDIGRRSSSPNTLNRTLFGTISGLGTDMIRPSYRSAKRASATVLEPVILNNGEALACIAENKDASATNVISSSPMLCSVLASVNGKMVSWQFTAVPRPGLALFSLENTGANTVKLLDVTFMELGSTDTPTIRLVPVGQMYGQNVGDTSHTGIAITKMDSTYPTLDATKCQVYTDIGIIPYGVPEVAIAPSSTGSPQGMNYLHTKDFNGPLYKVFLPEMAHMRINQQMSDTLGYSNTMKFSDIGVRKSAIVINPGEGIALVNSAETAVGTFPGFSGWPCLAFGVQVDSEPQASPALSITGLQSGSDIVILSPGTSTELLNVDANAGSTFSWSYDPDVVTGADVCIYKTGYVPYIIRNLSLGLSGVSIPVSQVADRNYSNP